MKALQPLRENFPRVTNELSKMMRICQTARAAYEPKHCSVLAFVFECLTLALTRGDMSETEATTTWFVGADSASSKSPGWVRMCATKKTVLEYISGAIHSAGDHVELKDASEKIIKTVLPKFDSPLSVLRAFAPEAPVEFTTFSRDVNGGLTTPQAGLTAEERVGLEAGMESTFSQWVDTLEGAGVKAAATLLYDIIVGTYDEASLVVFLFTP